MGQVFREEGILVLRDEQKLRHEILRFYVEEWLSEDFQIGVVFFRRGYKRKDSLNLLHQKIPFFHQPSNDIADY